MNFKSFEEHMIIKTNNDSSTESADMKLGLLVVVAVAVVLPSFSESRIVSKCELKDKLGKMINLPRNSKEKILAIGELKCICCVQLL